MLRQLLQLGLLAIVLIAFMFLPFMPGDYDWAAVALSNFAQALGVASVLLVPLGIVWLVFGRGEQSRVRIISAIVASILVVLAAAVSALISNSLSVALGLLVVGTFLAVNFVRRQTKIASPGFDATPLYLIVLPILILAFKIAFMSSAVEFSRSRGIQSSQQLINDIESFYARTGTYPVSLLSLWEDYKPGVIGISRYYYEPNGKAYNLYFEQFFEELGVREIVMYNKLGEHRVHSHNSDRLLLAPADQIRQQGWIRVVELPQANWRYFWFD